MRVAKAALVTPSMIGITGLAFYALTLCTPAFALVAGFLGTTPLLLAVGVGAAQNIATGPRRGRRHEQPLQQTQGRQVRAGGVEDRGV